MLFKIGVLPGGSAKPFPFEFTKEYAMNVPA